MDDTDTRWDAAAADLERAADALAACRFEDARALADGARRTLAEILGPDHPDHANALHTLGQIAAAEGDYATATRHLRAALAVYDGCSADPDDAVVVRPFRAEALATLGEVTFRAGDFPHAEPLLREALAEAEHAWGADALDLARFHNALGVHLRFVGRYAEAEAEYLRAAALREAHGVPHPSTHFHNLSGLATARGDFVAAEAHARAAIALSEAGGDDDGVRLGTDLCGLGDALAGQERFAEAERAYRRGLARLSARPDHPEVAYALHNLGDCLAALGRARDAEAAYRASLERKRAVFGDRHPEIAATLSNLAALLADTGRLPEARDASRRAVAMARELLPKGTPIRDGVEGLARSLRG
jgi:tetratricopeptide (TPR) repeat protein